MTQGLERRYGHGHHHFVTVSCYHRQPYFHSPESRQLFERCLEAIRQRYGFTVDSYVVMPEHIHVLVSVPLRKDLSVVMQALKVSVARKLKPRPFWQRRFYDFNVYTDAKRIDKRRYIHRNPFSRELVAHPREWIGSSYRHWATGEQGTVQIASTWTYAEQQQAEAAETSCKPTSQTTRCGAPRVGGEMQDENEQR